MGIWDKFKRLTEKANEIQETVQQVSDAVDGVNAAYRGAQNLLYSNRGNNNISRHGENDFTEAIELSDVAEAALDAFGVDNGGLELAENVGELAIEGLDLYRQSLEIQRDITKIRACSLVEIKRITEKYNIGHHLIEKVYDERKEALNKHYDLLDKAMATNNKEVLIMTLQNISGIVTSKPFDSFNEILKNWDTYNDDNPLLLDF